jgi:hypothetical protein
VVPVAGVAIDVLIVEEVATGLRSAMTAREAHKGSVAAVAGTQAGLEVEKVEQCFARRVGLGFESEGVEHRFARKVEVEVEVEDEVEDEVESEEVEHCSARTAVTFQYFLAEAGIEAGYCRRRNWAVR